MEGGVGIVRRFFEAVFAIYRFESANVVRVGINYARPVDRFYDPFFELANDGVFANGSKEPEELRKFSAWAVIPVKVGVNVVDAALIVSVNRVLQGTFVLFDEGSASCPKFLFKRLLFFAVFDESLQFVHLVIGGKNDPAGGFVKQVVDGCIRVRRLCLR